MDTRGGVSLDLFFINKEELIGDTILVGILEGSEHDMVLIQHLNHYIPLGHYGFCWPFSHTSKHSGHFVVKTKIINRLQSIEPCSMLNVSISYMVV